MYESSLKEICLIIIKTLHCHYNEIEIRMKYKLLGRIDLRVHIKTTSSFKGWKLPDQVERIISLSDAMDSDRDKKSKINKSTFI